MLALSRPSSRIIREYGLVDEFVKHGVQHIFNLTEYGEHPHCGDQLVPGGGFSYRPEEFTEKGVGYSNPAWEDMGCPSFELMEVVVRQAREILSKGGKVAVHCHAGERRGRTVEDDQLANYFAHRCRDGKDGSCYRIHHDCGRKIPRGCVANATSKTTAFGAVGPAGGVFGALCRVFGGKRIERQALNSFV